MPGQKNGAGDEIRTHDLHLGKVALYQLSYARSIMSIESFRRSGTIVNRFLENNSEPTTQ